MKRWPALIVSCLLLTSCAARQQQPELILPEQAAAVYEVRQVQSDTGRSVPRTTAESREAFKRGSRSSEIRDVDWKEFYSGDDGLGEDAPDPEQDQRMGLEVIKEKEKAYAARAQGELRGYEEFLPEPPLPLHVQPKGPLNLTWKERAVTEAELLKLNEKDPGLRPVDCWEILGRLNTRARYYMPDDIKSRRVMKVPNDFKSYKNWTPMPRTIPGVADLPKFILIAKEIPFIGWYEHGKLVGDSQICIGKQWNWTKAGLYRVLDKDINHFSQSYPNLYGQPTPMPFALRVYDHVWIHCGDVINGYYSHGCINVPLRPAEKLFHWADRGTNVLILDSLKDLNTVLRNKSDAMIPASNSPRKPQPGAVKPGASRDAVKGKPGERLPVSSRREGKR